MKKLYRPAGKVVGVEDAQIVGEALEDISRQRDLTPAVVVGAARSKKSPLHKYFTWDDTEAALKCRLREAGDLIRSVRVVIETAAGEEEVTLRAFVSVQPPADDGEENLPARKYVTSKTAMNDVEFRRQWLLRSFQELERLKREYGRLKEWAGALGLLEAEREKFLEREKAEGRNDAA